MFYETITGNFFNALTLKQVFWKNKKNWSKTFYLKALRLKKQHFHIKLLCQKPMLRQVESEYKIDLSQRTAFRQSLFYLFRNIVSFKAPRIKSWFDVPITQMPRFILFERVGVLLEGAFPSEYPYTNYTQWGSQSLTLLKNCRAYPPSSSQLREVTHILIWFANQHSQLIIKDYIYHCYNIRYFFFKEV